MNIVDISVQEECPEPVWLADIEPFVLRVLQKLNLDNWDVSLLFCRDPYMQTLNAEYRKIDAPTDVLSFELGSEYRDENDKKRFSAGDIVISIDSLQKNCEEFSVERTEELQRLLIHGILHLHGMDHSDNNPEQEMLRFQEELLKGMN